eukprot:TRINITY_DN3003_c0_g5_i3.p1 TRINITY_DN3003_c0_g5~~TRINITY_DN3003_c0_g5_i3.p1  ORF type:complete len:630 (-),score=199.41 TRINITY_DN3003_c0_g5_i3:139-2028(-)
MKIKPYNRPDQYSFEISQIDKYLGYIAWTEKLLYTSSMTDNQDVLLELIAQNAERPEAYVRLWAIYYRRRSFEQCTDISEQLFLEATEYEGKEIMLLIVWIYAKSLMREKQEIFAYQKLQYQYLLQSDVPMILYGYGKCIVKSTNEELRRRYLGSALSSFQECVKSCLSFRHGKVYFWMGRVYELRKDLVNSLYCYGRAMSLILAGSAKQKYVVNYINKYKEFQARANYVSERISLSRKGKFKPEDRAAATRSSEAVKHALKIVEKYDRVYAQYLAILHAFFVDKDVEYTKKLIAGFNKNSPLGLYCLLEIWNIQKKISDYKELKAIAKYIYGHLDSFDVPNNLWIKGHILCAKTLIKDKAAPNYSEAVRMLCELCKVLPSLPLLGKNFSIRQDLIPTTELDSNFCGALESQIIKDTKKEAKVFPRISVIEMEISSFAKDLPFDIHYSEKVKGDSYLSAIKGDRGHMRKCSAYMQQIMLHNGFTNLVSKSEKKYTRRKRSMMPSIGYTPKSSLSRENSIRSMESDARNNELFSASTQWDYLYLLGRVAVKYGVDPKFGVRVLSDLIGLLGLFMQENSAVGMKAKYWMANGLYEMGCVEEARKVASKVVASEEKWRMKVKKLVGKCQIKP